MSVYKLKKGSTLFTITGTLTGGDGEALDLSDADVVFHMSNSETGEVKINAEATIVDASAGEVEYAFTADDVDTAGMYYAEWRVEIAGSPGVLPPDGHHVVWITEPLVAE